jgi:N utilization substance protein B
MFQYQANGLRPEETIHLFEQNFDPKNDEDEGLEITVEDFEIAWPMAKDLFAGAVSSLGELDRDIDEASQNWALDRMSQVDLALLRMAYYEMRFRSEIPLKVSLNEALEIAKSFGERDSIAFINGVLDRLKAKAEKTRKPKETSTPQSKS